MNEFPKWRLLAVAASLGVMPGLALAQDAVPAETGTVAVAAEPAAATESKQTSPLHDGGYTSIMATYQKTLDDPHLSNSFGGLWLIGYRNGFYALETGLGYTVDGKIDHQSFKLRGLLFPFESLNLYGIIGGGITRYTKYPVTDTPMYIDGRDDFFTADLAAGLGYMFPIRTGNYEFALRAEAVYELGDRFLERENDFVTDIDAPSTFKDVVINIGLQLPLSKLPPPPPAPVPVAVVAPPPDSDGDGVPDDRDQCPDTPAGTQVDDKGCPLAPPCKTPEPGERVSLKGCGTGDVIILRGVNFEFDKSRLTPNAKIILDGVADELIANPQINVELGGHTDAKGSDEYNQRLSESRSKSVVKYLTEKGVAGERMSWKGYGESQPVADNETDEGRELNRRVELKIAGTSGPASVEATSAPAPAEAAPAEVAAPAEAAPAPASELAPAAEAPPADTATPVEALPAPAPSEGGQATDPFSAQ